MRHIILHCFLWQLQAIIKNLSKIKAQGYDVILISTINEIKKGDAWWCDYQPESFKIGNRHGSKADLIELCSKANKLGIIISVDIVLRHVAGDDYGNLIPHQDVDKSLTCNPNFLTNAPNCTDFNSRFMTTNYACGMPMLNYNNHELQDIYVKFLTELRECGVGSFRLDMMKHYSLSSEGSDFFERVFGGFQDMFNYGECLDCSRELLDEYTKVMNVLSDKDCTDKSKMVTYFMSHDTELTFGYTLHMTDEIIIREWEHLLRDYKESHVLFYCRSFSNLWQSDEIKKINLELR